jgi:hypothetical protein
MPTIPVVVVVVERDSCYTALSVPFLAQFPELPLELLALEMTRRAATAATAF